MSAIFKLISSNDWEDAKITGVIPKTEIDLKAGGYHVYQMDDLEKLCKLSFAQNDYPIALELEPSSLISQLTWHQPNQDRAWKEGIIKSVDIYADLVMNIYSFEWGDTDGETWCKIVGE
ncbi:MAG: hypothetical protein COA86_09640 [Kangiella sp.]|nr:MAG: hypothetical protein COA86_09640 [Kangiella sp.]